MITFPLICVEFPLGDTSLSSGGGGGGGVGLSLTYALNSSLCPYK